jgi:hypothetical protein
MDFQIVTKDKEISKIVLKISFSLYFDFIQQYKTLIYKTGKTITTHLIS